MPGDSETEIVLPCGEQVRVPELDMGMREYECSCGNRHGVVMDVHPPERFLPEFLVEVLQEFVEPADDMPSFGTTHLMGLVLEEFPDEIVVKDTSGDGTVGYAMVWITSFDSEELHRVVVELVLELMNHAVSHAEDTAAVSEFEAQLNEFDIDEFVRQYREERGFSADDFPGY